MEKKTKACPFCWEQILQVAKKCRYCGEFLEADKKKEIIDTRPEKEKKWNRTGCIIWSIVFFVILLAWIIASSGSKSSYKYTPTTTSISTTKTTTPKTTTATTTEKKVSREYESALKSAQIYADKMHMSKQDIFDQLTSEYGWKFEKDAAEYAVNNIVADYKKNALESAEFYSDKLHMSKKDIYDQLISSHWWKFTKEEAQYAIDHL